MKTKIFVFALINCLIYILVLLLFKYLNLLHVYGLRMINYGILTIISLVQIHSIIKNLQAIPFLQSFFLILATGSLSFLLFGLFLFAYSFIDPFLNPLYVTHYGGQRITPTLYILFEGTGASVIIGLVSMFYSSQFESGEKTTL